MNLNPHLMFKGECETAFKFYASCLGGKILAMMTHEGTPTAEHVPAAWRDKIIHARIQVGDTTLMGADAPPDRYEAPKGFSVCLRVASAEEAERVFRDLGKGGTVGMAIQPTFFAVRFGMLVDRFGTPWMVICEMAAQS